MKFAIIVFPGSNCDRDAYHAARDVVGQAAEYIWHKDSDLKGADVVVLPAALHTATTFGPERWRVSRRSCARSRHSRGGAARCSASAMASRCCSKPGCSRRDAPQSRAEIPVRARARWGRAARHAVHGAVSRRTGPPHPDRPRGEGNYFAEPDVIARLEANRQVVFRYATAAGEVTDAANPNGSAAAIAGLCNEARNVVGMMPHPERACQPILGSGDGLPLFESVVHSLKTGALVARA